MHLVKTALLNGTGHGSVEAGAHFFGGVFRCFLRLHLVDKLFHGIVKRTSCLRYRMQLFSEVAIPQHGAKVSMNAQTTPATVVDLARAAELL